MGYSEVHAEVRLNCQQQQQQQLHKTMHICLDLGLGTSQRMLGIDSIETACFRRDGTGRVPGQNMCMYVCM